MGPKRKQGRGPDSHKFPMIFLRPVFGHHKSCKKTAPSAIGVLKMAFPRHPKRAEKSEGRRCIVIISVIFLVPRPAPARLGKKAESAIGVTN